MAGKIKAVIFDLDGTLLYTIESIASGMNSVLEKHGLPTHTAEQYKMFVGDGAANLTRRSLSGAALTDEEISQIEKDFRSEYVSNQPGSTRPFDGVPELLAGLAAKGVKTAVLSNTSHGSTLRTVEFFFRDTPFDAVIGLRPGHNVKPDPGSALEILEILGVEKGDVLYVGDTGTDMKTAKAAGLKAVGALWGYRSKKELEDNGADVYAEHPRDVLMFI
ncbi:MAG: HAD family hydrolase [Oscillospiraceae bacterium]|nr:HAD family hydrolase [Oscillospiraceae bacterium]